MDKVNDKVFIFVIICLLGEMVNTTDLKSVPQGYRFKSDSKHLLDLVKMDKVQINLYVILDKSKIGP